MAREILHSEGNVIRFTGSPNQILEVNFTFSPEFTKV